MQEGQEKKARTKCLTDKPQEWSEHTTLQNLTGRRFGRLVVESLLERRDYKGSAYWLCRCDCGNKVEVTQDRLVWGNTTSCGCRKQEIQENILDTLHFVDGTCVEWLRSRKARSDNTSGFRGVYYYKGRYRVSIGLQGKRYYLGSYTQFEEACQARLEAEKVLHDDFVKNWEWWNGIATQDAKWAQDHPFKFEVRQNNGQLEVDVPVMAEVQSYGGTLKAQAG